MSGGPTRLAEVIEAGRAADQQATFTTGQVVAGSTDTHVAVEVAGQVQRWPYLSSYTPRVGDAVVLGGAPGWWVCLGTVSRP